MRAKIVYEGQIMNRLPDLKVGDYGAVLTFYILNQNGSQHSLENTSVKFVSKEFVTDKILINSPCIIMEENNGICAYVLKNNDLVLEGSFDCYLTIKTNGLEQKIALGYLNIFSR